MLTMFQQRQEERKASLPPPAIYLKWQAGGLTHLPQDHTVHFLENSLTVLEGPCFCTPVPPTILLSFSGVNVLVCLLWPKLSEGDYGFLFSALYQWYITNQAEREIQCYTYYLHCLLLLYAPLQTVPACRLLCGLHDTLPLPTSYLPAFLCPVTFCVDT